MAIFKASPPYVRLRRRPDDERLYVTENGITRPGQLVGAGLIYRSNDFPYLTLDLEDTDPLAPDVKPIRFELRAPDIFAADIDALAIHAERDSAYYELQRCAGSLRDAFSAAVPECRHENVIETPELGRVDTPGICVWCPTPLLRVDDEWKPA